MIKFEIGTEKFNEIINKAYKGVGNMGMFVITSAICLEGKDGNLILRTTDNSTNLVVVAKDVLPKDLKFYTATNASLLKSLVNKTTSATIELEIHEDKIVFSGNCDANLPIILGDEGTDVVKIKDTVVEGDAKEVKTADLKNFLRYLKGTIPDSTNNPQYMAYRVGKNFAMSYDEFGLNYIKTTWETDDILIPTTIVDLFELLDDEVVTVIVGKGKIKVSSGTVIITGSLRSDVDKYPVERFEKIVFSKEMFNNEAVLDKSKLVDVLDRLSLFVTKDEKFKFIVEFDKDCMLLLSKDKDFVEKISFESSTSDVVAERIMTLTTLKSAISSLKGDKVTLNIGKDGGVRVVEDNSYLVLPYARKI